MPMRKLDPVVAHVEGKRGETGFGSVSGRVSDGFRRDLDWRQWPTARRALVWQSGAITVQTPCHGSSSGMSLSHRFLRALRSAHLYLGVFTAPMLLFFALTGGLQVFSLHETTRGSGYVPPAWLASAAQLHKKQTLEMPQRRRPSAAVASNPPSSPQAAAPQQRASTVDARPAEKSLLPMKIFFALVAFGLFVSVLSGLIMAWKFSRRPALFGTLLGAGICVPLLLLLL